MPGQVVGEPLAHLTQKVRLVGAHFFFHFTERRLKRRLALIDSALRHLPTFDGLIDSPADEDQTLTVNQHDPHARPIRQVIMLEETAGTGHENCADYFFGDTMAD